MEQGEKGGSMKYQSYTLKDFLLSSHLEQMEFLLLSPGALQTAYAKECWSGQFLKFLKTVVYLSNTVFLQTLACNDSGKEKGEKELKEVEEEGEKKAKAEEEEEEGMEKKGDTPEKEKGSSSKGPGKKKLGELSPQQIDAKVLNVLCSVLEEWETAKVWSHYGKRIVDGSFVSSPLGRVKDRGSTMEKVPKSKVKLLKETPEKTDKKVTLRLEEVEKESMEWTLRSNQLRRSQSLTSADRGLRSRGKVQDEGSPKGKVPKAEKKPLEELPKKAKEKSLEESPKKAEEKSLEESLKKAKEKSLEELPKKAEEKSLEESPKKADRKETLQLKEEIISIKPLLQRLTQSLKLEESTFSEVFEGNSSQPFKSIKSMKEGREGEPRTTTAIKSFPVKASCNTILFRSEDLFHTRIATRDLSRGKTEVKEAAEVSDVKLKKHSEEDVKVSKKTQTLLKSGEGLTELSKPSKAVSGLIVSAKKDRENETQTSLQHPTTVLSSPCPQPVVFSSPYQYTPPVVFSPPSPPPVYSRPTVVYSPPSPPPVYSPPTVVYSPPTAVYSPPAPKFPAATPKPSAPAGYVHVREHYRQGHEVKGHWRGDTWVDGYYRQGHTVRSHYRKK